MPNTPTHKPKVFVAMSGGVDSSAAAALLVRQGYEVAGITMRIASAEAPESSDNVCPALDAAHEARRVAERLGIPHYAVNLVQRFEREIVGDFVREYLAGRTPNPCNRCNQRVKFGALFDKARAIGADYIATGHYVRKVERKGRVGLQRAVHRPKDQSYALAGLSQEQLRGAMYPLGELAKDDVRALARELDLGTADKAESQEICFVPGDDYRSFLMSRAGPGRPGPIVNQRGEVLGEHKGLMYYTVGQRKGLGVAAPEPLYVLRMDVANNTLVVGYADETFCGGLVANNIVWGAQAPTREPFSCAVQIRYNHTAVPAVCEPGDDDSLTVRFAQPQRAVTPGQWAVLYDAEEVILAAGLIDRSLPTASPAEDASRHGATSL